jgi:hypothetical protein
MRRALVILGVSITAVLLVAGLDVLSDLTQTRPDAVDHTIATEVSFEVETQAYDGTEAEAAEAQWAACAGTVGGTTTPSGVELVDGRRFRVIVEPAIGPRGKQRLAGCLTDAVVDRVRTGSVAFVILPVADPAQ